MSKVACALLVELPRVRRSLRRFARYDDASKPCVRSYHDASVPFDEIDLPIGDTIPAFDASMAAPERFPGQCTACVYQFHENDVRQIFCERLYRVGDTNTITTLRHAAVGAMWWADWMGEHHLSARAKARDGRQHLVLKTPDGDWDIDAQSSNGDGWDRTGEPPIVTARPSILMTNYHGFLTNGILESC